MKKYELLEDDYIQLPDRKLYRIRALRNFGDVKKGDIGGYIESEDNLSHQGGCWIGDTARVYNNARVCNNAIVWDNTIVCDNARVCGNAWVCDNAWVYGNTKVYGNAIVYDNAKVCGNAKIQNGQINHRMVVNSKSEDVKFFVFTKARDITALKVNGEWLFNIGCQNLITKEVFLKRIKSDGGVKAHPHRQDYLDILKLF